MRVLIVHRYFWPENVAVTALALRHVAAFHLGRGDEVQVVTGSSGDFADAWRAAFGPALGDRIRIAAFRAGIDRERGLARRILASARLAVAGLRHLLFARRWDLVYTISYPPLLAGLLALAGRTRHLVFLVQDNLAYRVPTAPLRWLYRWQLRATIRRASRVITLSEDMAEELAVGFPPAERAAVAAKTAVIQNIAAAAAPAEADADTDTGAPSAPLRDIVYAGNHGPAQNLGHFLEILASPLLDPKPRVAFFGSGSEREALIARARALGLDGCVEFRATVGGDEIRREIARSRFGLVGARPGLMRHAFPSKLLAYAAEGTPGIVMCGTEGRTARWLGANRLGHAIDPCSVEDGARQLRSVLAAAVPDGDRAARIAFARREFGLARYLGQLGALLDGLDRGRDTENRAE